MAGADIGSYGMNADGAPGGSAFSRGIGGVRESEVRVPADMVVILDSYLFTVSAAHAQYHDHAVREGEIIGQNSQGFALGAMSSYRNAPGSKAGREQRHRGRWNTLFCDGHVENLAHGKLFERSDRAARRWNLENAADISKLPE